MEWELGLELKGEDREKEGSRSARRPFRISFWMTRTNSLVERIRPVLRAEDLIHPQERVVDLVEDDGRLSVLRDVSLRRRKRGKERVSLDFEREVEEFY